MKKFSILILFLIVVVFSSCYDDCCYWEFEQTYTSIAAIQIIDTEDGYVYDVVNELDLKFAKEVCEDIQKLEMKKYGTNLKTPSGYCFLIAFENGDYDVISQNESKHFRYDQASKQIKGYNSWLRCSNPASFDKLIDKYLDS